MAKVTKTKLLALVNNALVEDRRIQNIFAEEVKTNSYFNAILNQVSGRIEAWEAVIAALRGNTTYMDIYIPPSTIGNKAERKVS
jgi:hypothetical protein